MRGLERHRRPIGFVQNTIHRLVGHWRQAVHADAVAFVDQVIHGTIGKRQRHQALLFQVGFVNTGKRARENHHATAIARLHRCVFAR